MNIFLYISIILLLAIAFLLFKFSLHSKEYKKEQNNSKLKFDELSLLVNEKDKILNEKNLAYEKMQLEVEKEREKIKAKNQKLWKLSETVYKEKKQVDEDNKKLSINQEKYKVKIKKLWEQSLSVHKEKERIDSMKKEIEAVYKEVSDSINYAKRIQNSILPNDSILKKHVSDYFVLFKPKDKVSGDFYWWTNVENHTIITAVDCTGHGVPGAFMSMLGVSFLREIVENEYITHTGVILRKMRKEIIKALKQKGEVGEQKDGMDMAIISIDHNTNIVQFSGAHNPLYILTNRKLENYEPVKDLGNFYEIKADKMPIAIYDRMNKFTTHEIQLEKGDLLYIFSDGFADQFGGPKEKKFKYPPFKRLLNSLRYHPLKEQKQLLNKAYEDWRGDVEQIDDVVVIGVKL